MLTIPYASWEGMQERYWRRQGLLDTWAMLPGDKPRKGKARDVNPKILNYFHKRFSASSWMMSIAVSWVSSVPCNLLL